MCKFTNISKKIDLHQSHHTKSPIFPYHNWWSINKKIALFSQKWTKTKKPTKVPKNANKNGDVDMIKREKIEMFEFTTTEKYRYHVYAKNKQIL